MSIKLPKTREEKIAEQLSKTVGDLTLDLENVGRRLAWYSPNVIYRRLVIILEAMIHERENDERNNLQE